MAKNNIRRNRSGFN